MIQKRFLELPPSQQRCLQPFLFASHIFNMNSTHTHTHAPLAIGRVASRIICDWHIENIIFHRNLCPASATQRYTHDITRFLFSSCSCNNHVHGWVFLQFSLHSGVQVHEQRNVYIGAPRWTHGKVQRFPCPILSPGAPCRRKLNTASPRRSKIARKTCPLNSRQVQVLFEVQSSSLLCIFFAETSQRLALEKLMLV